MFNKKIKKDLNRMEHNVFGLQWQLNETNSGLRSLNERFDKTIDEFENAQLEIYKILDTLAEHIGAKIKNGIHLENIKTIKKENK